MQGSAESVIEQLRQRVEAQASRMSEKFRATAFKENNEAAEKPTLNIFANSKKPEKVSLFGPEKASVNLFQLQKQDAANLFKRQEQGAKSIFDEKQKSAVVCQDEGNSLTSESQSPNKSQALFKSEPDVKIMKYEYKNDLEKVGQFPLNKFKSGVSPAKEEVYATLEKNPLQSGVLHLMIRSCGTKIVLYQALMMKNISNPEHFMGKEDNLRFEVVKKRKEEGAGKEVVKLQFRSEEESERFVRVMKDNF